MASVVRDRTDSRVRGDCRIAHRRQAGASHGVRRVLPSRQGRRLEERAGRRGERGPGEPFAVEYLRGWDRMDPIRCDAAARRARGTRRPVPARRRRPSGGPGRGAQRHGRTA